ncbi:hypothetical protein ACIPSE_10980 [Streptomyces sp. NPDC090106]
MYPSQANDIGLVFPSTSRSRPNWIEPDFAALRHYALNGTGHRSHG